MLQRNGSWKSWSLVWMLGLVSLVAGCGGGGSAPAQNPPAQNTPPPIAAPSGLSYGSAQTYTVGTAIAPLAPSVTGSATGYSVAPALPAGLQLETTTGRVTGTPTATMAATQYTFTASNSGGSTTASLSIRVVDAAPTGLSYTSPVVLYVDQASAPLLPTVTGKVTQYSVTPGLPAGLVLDAATGAISGTPTAPVVATNFRISASNDGGASEFALPITVLNFRPITTRISRTVVAGTSVDADIRVQFSQFTGTPTASISNNEIFGTTVGFRDNGDGTHSFMTTTKTNVPEGHYTGVVSLDVCTGSDCTLAAVSIPYDIFVMSAASTWPGDHLSQLAPWDNVPDWVTFQGNAAHTGYVPIELDPNLFTTRWKWDGPPIIRCGSYCMNFSNLATSSGLFLLSNTYGAQGPNLYARREHDATEVWQKGFAAAGTYTVNPPAVDAGVVYLVVGDQDQTRMEAFKTVDGSPVFSAPMLSQWNEYLAPTIGRDGIYTNGGRYGGVYAFDRSGQSLFFNNLSNKMIDLWTPAVNQYGVHTYTDKYLRVFHPTTGALIEQIYNPYDGLNYGYDIGGSTVLGAAGSVFAATYSTAFMNNGTIGNSLAHFNLDTDTVDWHVNGNYPTTPAYHDGVLYVANENPLRLEARAEADGTLLWQWVPPHVGDNKFRSEVLLTKNMVFVGTNLSTYAIDLNTRRTVWSYPLVGHLALSKSGVLYIHAETQLAAFNVK